MITAKIDNVWSDIERNKIADIYTFSRSTKFSRDTYAKLSNLIKRVARTEVNRANVKVEYVDYQPYLTSEGKPSAQLMRETVQSSGVLLIATEGTENQLLNRETNLLFRVAHDLHHIRGERCDFSFAGETCAVSKFLAYTRDTDLQAILFSEIVGQFSYYWRYKEYAPAKHISYSLYRPYIQHILTTYKIGE